MLNCAVECFRCWKSLWHATGRIMTNSHGIARAECVCEACRYVFWSPRPTALAAARLLTPPPTMTADPVTRVSIPHPDPDFKLRQTGDCE